MSDWFVPTGDEVQKVAFVAHERVFKKTNLGWKNRGGLVTDKYKDYCINLYGAFGEYFVSKYLNIMWGTGLVDVNGADLVSRDGHGIQVKTSIYPTGGLIHREYETATDFHVLVVADDQPFSFKIAGWMSGEEVRNEEYYDDPIMRNGRPPCYFVKQENLYDIKALKHQLDIT